MNNQLQVFNNEVLGSSLRVLMIEGVPWFVGKDVAEALGYSRPAEAIRKHVDTEDTLKQRTLTNGGEQTVLIINESGLYSLILSSKLPSAKQFKRWVTSEILPSIRQHGMYLTADKAEEAKQDPLSFLAEALKVADNVIKKQQEQITALKPKAAHYDEYMNREDTYTVSAAAQFFGLSSPALFKLMTAAGWLIKPPACKYQIGSKAPKGVFTVRKIYWAKQERGEQIRILASGMKKVESLIYNF